MLEAEHCEKHGQEKWAADLASSWKVVLNYGFDVFCSLLAGGVDIAVSFLGTVH